ncbi:MAG TPA: LacI family DNA-binding transcriptional regulator [Beijerinckiaceae bacterium]|jgi:LacI family repressor for deo operon, udp, cdd, tsx, nupC, and nupG
MRLRSAPSIPPDPRRPAGLRPARIADVARLAGVSTATVSRALSTPERVSAPVRVRVLEAVEQVGYLPNPAARSLRSQKSRMVLVVLPDLANAFFSRILQGLEDVLFEAGYGMIIGNLDGSPEKEARFAAFLATGHVDGAILLNGRLIGQTRDGQGEAAPTAVPLVALCEAIPGAAIPQVEVDNRVAARRATLHLAGQGRRRIAYVAGPAGNVLERERFAGYREGLCEAGLAFDADLVLAGDYSLEAGVRAAEILIRGPLTVDAVFCSSDAMAVGLMGALADAGIEVPRAVAVAGFDDIELASMVRPALTTIHQPRREIGRMGARVLLDLIAGRDVAHHTVLETHLVVRSSTG